MKAKIFAILATALALSSCIFSENLPTPEEKLNKAARTTFSKSVLYSTRILYFCEMFQNYMDAADEQKAEKKFTDIRESISLFGKKYGLSNVYSVNTLDRFIDLASNYSVLYDSEILISGIMEHNDISIFETGGKIEFYRSQTLWENDLPYLTVSCVEPGKWQLICYELQLSYREKGDFDINIRIDSGNDEIYLIACDGCIKSEGYDNHHFDNDDMYRADFYTIEDIRYNRTKKLFSGQFHFDTFDEDNDPEDRYSLAL